MTWRAFIQLLVTLLGLSGAKAKSMPRVQAGVSRRAFLKAMGMSAAALVALEVPFALDQPLDLDEHVSGLDVSLLDSILKDIYEPAIVAQLNAPNTLLAFMAVDAPTTPPWLTGPVHYTRNAS